MSRFTKTLLIVALLSAPTLAAAQNGPPAAADLGLGIASAAAGKDVPVRAGSVPEPETWLFSLGGLLAARLLRRRKR